MGRDPAVSLSIESAAPRYTTDSHTHFYVQDVMEKGFVRAWGETAPRSRIQPLSLQHLATVESRIGLKKGFGLTAGKLLTLK